MQSILVIGGRTVVNGAAYPFIVIGLSGPGLTIDSAANPLCADELMHLLRAAAILHCRAFTDVLQSWSYLGVIVLAGVGNLQAQVAVPQCPPRYVQKVTGSGGATIWCEQQTDGVRWIVERPEVRRQLTVYPDIRFAPGDRVTVRAKGCVNTGNRPKMWKRYVDPYGNDTDRFYHGLIWIPGARIEHQGERLVTPVGTAPVRISGIAGGMNADLKPDPQEFVIDPPSTGIESALRLGYESAHYKDNGYAGEPSGNGCDKPGVGHATIVISIRGSGGPLDSRRLPLPFDPVSKETDLNGFMLSPQWAGNYNSVTGEQREALRDCDNFPYNDPIRVHRGIENPCSTQASYDVPSTWTQCLLEPALGQLHGHVNWTPATYVGQLSFEDFSADGDLDFKLFDFSSTSGPQRLGASDTGKGIRPILTEDSQRDGSIFKDALWLEFAGYEITEHFSAGGWPFFQYFAFQRIPGMVKERYDIGLRRQFFRKTAVITGLLGLDCVHDCHTELHPVYAMAVRTKYECGGAAGDQIGGDGACLHPEHKNTDILSDDSWMLFVSNTGNEGSCARDEHYLYRDSLTLVLPAPPGATEPGRVIAGTQSLFSNVTGLQWSWEPVGGGVAVTVALVPPSCAGVHSGAPVRIHGALHLNWSDQNVEPRRLSVDLGPKEIAREGKTPDGPAPRNEPKPAPAGDAEPVELVQDGVSVPSCQGSSTSDEEIMANADAYERQQAAFTRARDAKTRTDFWTVMKFVGDYTGKNLSVFGELQQFATAQDFALGVGARAELLSTPLGSLETEGVTTFPTLVTSSASQFHVRTTAWLTGLRLQVARAGSPFLDVAKVGYMWRSADSAAAENTEFRHFKGHNFIIYTGAGFEPRRRNRISLRVTGGVVFMPATGEKILRLTAGLHFRGRK